MIVVTASCFVLSGFFIIMAVIFALLKEKGAILMAGFNDFSKEKRSGYDQKRIVSDTRNKCLLWSAVLLVGGALSFFVRFYFGIAALVVFLILVCKDIKFDADKAFEKYKFPVATEIGDSGE